MTDIYFNGMSAFWNFDLDLVWCSISTPIRKQEFASVPYSDGEFDQLQRFGPARYEMRTIVARFSMLRSPKDTVDRLLRKLEGQQVKVVLPDKPNYYLVGTAHISAAGFRVGDIVTITVNATPWRQALKESIVSVPASDTAVTYILHNRGERDVVPELIVSESDTIVIQEGAEVILPAGTYYPSYLTIPGGGACSVTLRGGAAQIRYREAIL